MIYLWSGALLIWKVFWMDPKLRIYHGFVDHLSSSFRIFLLIFFQNFFIWKFFLFLYLKIPFLKKNIYKRFFFFFNSFPWKFFSFAKHFFSWILFLCKFFFFKIPLLKNIFTKDYFFENFSSLQKNSFLKLFLCKRLFFWKFFFFAKRLSSFLEFHFFFLFYFFF